MTLKSNVQQSGASAIHSDAVVGELAPYVAAAGNSQATATLLRRLTRHIVTSGTGGVAFPPGVGHGDTLEYGDEIEITNATLADINIYPPTGSLFLGGLTNAAIVLSPQYSVAITVDSSTRLIPKYWQTGSGTPGLGTVTSVGLALPSSILSVSGSPVTSAGTLTGSLITQSANFVWAGPTTGSPANPTFRSLVRADIPALTSGTSILYGDGSGGFSNVTIGSNLTFIGGTLTATGGGTGSVTSVGLSAPAIFTVSGSPVTTSGTLSFSLANESANLVWAGPTSGSPATPTFRSLVISDLPPTVVTTTGSPASGNLAKFTGAATASNGDLSGDVTTSGTLVTTIKANLKTAQTFFQINGNGSAITTGVKGYMQIEFDCTITAATLLVDQTGSIVVNIWKCTYAQFDAGSTHPVVGDKITSSTPPTISSATKATDSTLTSWTTTITAGDVLAFNVDSATTVTRAELMLKLTKT